MTKIYKGIDALNNPYFTQGTAFTRDARTKLGLRGLLPPRPLTLEIQAKRAMTRLHSYESAIEKYEFLDSLRHRNRTLFYYLLVNHIEELMPIVYTPTVGKACVEYDHIARNIDGLYVSIEDLGSVKEVVSNCPLDDVEIIVVTDGERILGLGDLGTGGMGIPKGKLSLYVACAGLHPDRTLPVCIDVGTNNLGLQQDPFYTGLQIPRVGGEKYYALMDEFIEACKERWPNILIQFEDFGGQHAFGLLDRWKDKATCFNDDIQGTAAVVLSGFYSACRIKKQPLKNEKILFLGAGEAAIGIADLMVNALEKEGLASEEARQRIFLFDSKGLVVRGRSDLNEVKLRYAHPSEECATFLEAIDHIKPTAIVGVSAQAGAFNAYVLTAMARINERPVIFALSNPTSKAECTAREAYTYTEGRCIFACGSPFGPVEIEGKTYVPRQGNNSYVFPGIGLGLVASKARIVPQEVFLAAAKTLTETVSDEDLQKGSLFPALKDIREVSKKIAVSVAKTIYACNLAQNEISEPIEEFIDQSMYWPVYKDL